MIVSYLSQTDPDSDHITQISALVPGTEGNVYSQYVTPKVPMHPKASSVTGITYLNGQLYKNGQPQTAVTIREAMGGFIEYLRHQGSPESPVVLVGHNIKHFDWPFLRPAAVRCEVLDTLTEVAPTFIDTLFLFRHTRSGLSSYRQEYLYTYFVGGTYSAHDALSDVTALAELLPHARASREEEKQFTFKST